ncbi:peptide transporter family 1 [Prorops nasuta]|uniref:peptide transporter family 1 n=1 Tax=Prorops nasuta TaxID=863751 RepID=UPI0034CF05EF
MEMNDIQDQKLKYPKSIFFIISNEFCERFSFYGMKTILVLYLKDHLMYTKDTSTVIYHAFSMFVYFFPLFGAMLADSMFGKFRTIFYLSIVYAFGQVLLSVSATTLLGLTSKEFSLIGLLLIAIGSGGIKPCVAAFGGDQFVLPQQERYFATFFSLYYFSVNSGSLISTFFTPILRSNVQCFGEDTCVSLAFLVPAILMVMSIVIFVLGKRSYRMKDPEGNVVVKVAKCISCAIYEKAVSSKGDVREHWLDHADKKYDSSLISDIKAALQVLKLFIPLPIFWALFDQQGSRWTIQATKMDGEIGGYLIEPDQMQVANPLLILLFIPFFETCVYPLLSKLCFVNTPLRKLGVGGSIAALSFVVSGLVELQLEKTYPILPTIGTSQLQIFNTMNCNVNVTLGEAYEPSMQKNFVLEGLSMWKKEFKQVKGNMSLQYTVNYGDCGEAKQINGILKIYEKETDSWGIYEEGIHSYHDDIRKSKTGKPAIRALMYVERNKVTPNEDMIALNFKDKSKEFLINITTDNFTETTLQEVKPGTYDVYLKNRLLLKDLHLKLGGVYTILGTDISDDSGMLKSIVLTAPNSLHILWLLPQYIIITVAEVMFSVTGLEFAFTQAPSSMKSLLQASWLLTVAFGNLIVVIVTEISIFNSQAYEFFLFAFLMALDVLIFTIMSIFYKYVNIEKEASINEEISLERTRAANNYKQTDDEK